MKAIVWAVVVPALAVALLLNVATAHAKPGSENDPPNPPPATIDAETELPGDEVPGDDGSSGGGSEPVLIPCSWFDVPTTQAAVDVVNGVMEIVADVLATVNGQTDVVALTYYVRFDVLHKAGDTPGEWLKAQTADCTYATAPGDDYDGKRRWVDSEPPDPATLIDPTRRRVTETVDAPVPAINPAGPGFSQLGMWLAVEDAGPYSARAQLPAVGPALVWAETTATLSATTFTFDSGGSVRCDGAGTPIPNDALDDIREGPCGHTFRDFVGETTITMTSEWTISWELSDGRSGVEPDPLILTATIPYEVLEIQTVGVPQP